MPYIGGRGFVYPPPWPYFYDNNMHYTPHYSPPPSSRGSSVYGYFLQNSPTYSMLTPSDSSINTSLNDLSLLSPTPPSFETSSITSSEAVPSFSSKVFVGRVPHSVTQNTPFGRALECIFRRFGEVDVQWPKAATHPTRNHATRLTGYLFLLYKNADSVKELRSKCLRSRNGELFLDLGHALDSIKLHVRLWSVEDAFYSIDETLYLNPTMNTVFLGRVPRVCTARQIATMMESMFGKVLAVNVDVDATNHYPQGSAAVYFERQKSYLSALKTQKLDMSEVAGREWVTEIKPFIRFGGACDECEKRQATLFCAELRCLQYYCKFCWYKMHDKKNPSLRGHIPFEECIPTEGRNIPPTFSKKYDEVDGDSDKENIPPGHLEEEETPKKHKENISEEEDTDE